MDPKEFERITGNLSGATDEELTAARAAIREQVTELAQAETTEETVEKIEAAQERYAEIGSTLALRSRAANALNEFDDAEGEQSSAPDGSGRLDPNDSETDNSSEGQPERDGGESGNESQDSGDKGDDGKGKSSKSSKSKNKDDDSRTASARNLGSLANGKNEPRPQRSGGVVTTRAVVQGDIAGFTAGQSLSMDQLSHALAEKASVVSRGGAGTFPVARLFSEYPEDRQLSTDAETNVSRVGKVRSPEALTAAGLCLPLDNRYDIEVIGVTDRPVRDALTRFQTPRGGINYRAPYDVLDPADGGIGVWTIEDDTADPVVPKTCKVVDCPGVLTANLYSTYACLEFANMTARFDPESARAITEASMVAWARFAENRLLAQMAAGSKTLTSTQQLGTVRDVLASLDKSVSYYRNRHRLSDNIPLRLIAPRWLIDQMRTDIARQLPSGDVDTALTQTVQAINGYFASRGVNVTWHLDGNPGATANGVTVSDQFYANATAGSEIPGWPEQVDALLFREGDWLFLDGGTLDLGLVRDSNLNLRNRYQTFLESFEGVAFDGVESLRLVLNLAATGASSGTLPPENWDAAAPAGG